MRLIQRHARKKVDIAINADGVFDDDVGEVIVYQVLGNLPRHASGRLAAENSAIRLGQDLNDQIADAPAGPLTDTVFQIAEEMRRGRIHRVTPQMGSSVLSKYYP